MLVAHRQSRPCTTGRRRRSVLLVALLPAVSGGGLARADVVVPAGHPAMVGVRLTRFEKGQLYWRGVDGTEASRGIDEIAYLQITGWQAFNTAERQLRENHPRQAVASYQQALAALTDGSATPSGAEPPLDRLTLLRCRLLRAAEADGQYELAVRTYIQLLESSDGTALRMLQPRRIPDPRSAQFAPARRVLDAAVARHGDDEVGRILEQWRRIWPPAPVPETRPAPAAAPAPVIATPEPALSLPEATSARIQALHRAGRFDEALALLRNRHETVSGLERAETFYWEAQTYLARAALQQGDVAADRRRAGLACMRIVVHFPESPRAPEALQIAGRICYEEGRVQRARLLWEEAITRYPAGNTWVERARQELNRLSAESQPAR